MPRHSNIERVYDIDTKRGATLREHFSLEDSAGVAVPTTGHAFLARVWPAECGTGTPAATFSVIIESESLGYYALELNDVTTAAFACGSTMFAAASAYEWDMRVTRPDGTKFYPYGGTLRVKP